MELKIDNEFRDLIPPLTEEEYKGLEENLLTNGFNPAFPVIVWKGQEIIIDGHNRYGICQKHGIAFTTIEQEFESRDAVSAWILDNQLARRNINAITRNDLIGRRYTVQKRISSGRPEGSKECHQNDDINFPKQTRFKIADQVGVGAATVERAEKLSQAIDTITQNTGITRADILSGKITGTQEAIKELAKLDKSLQVRAMEKILEDKDDIETAIRKVNREESERQQREAEKKRKELEAQ